MIIREIDGEEFNRFAKTHILKNYFQTKNKMHRFLLNKPKDIYY